MSECQLKRCSVRSFFRRCSTSPKCLVQSFVPTFKLFPYMFLYETNYDFVRCFDLSICLSIVRCIGKQLEAYLLSEILYIISGIPNLVYNFRDPKSCKQLDLWLYF